MPPVLFPLAQQLGPLSGPRGAVAAPFDWSAIANIVLAYEQDSAYQDTGLTTLAAANGDPVNGLKDLSGNSRHATATAKQNRRLMTGVVSGQGAVSFVNDGQMTVASPATLTDFYVFAVVRWPKLTAGLKAVLGDDTNTFLANATSYLYTLVSSTATDAYPYIPDQYVLLESYRSGTTWKVYLNGLKWGNDVTVAGTSIQTKYVGQNMIGGIALLAVLSAAPSSPDLATIRSYVQQKYHCPGKHSWNQVDGGTVSVPSTWTGNMIVRQDGSLYENTWAATNADGTNTHWRDSYSTDEGDTWSVPRTWHDQTTDPSYPAGLCSVGMYQRPNGDIVFPTHIGIAGLPDQSGAIVQRLWISHDNAATYPTTIDVPTSDAGLSYANFTEQHGRMFEVGGRIFFPHYAIREGGNGGTDAIILKSDDNLATWQLYSVVAQYTSTFIPSETAVLRISSTFWLAVSRDDYDPNNYLYQCYSTDGGATWSTPTAIFTEAATNHVSPDMCLLQSGKIALAYGNRPYGSVVRLGTWDGIHTVTWGPPLYVWRYATFTDGQAGYPSIVQMPSGDLGAVYMINRDNTILPGLLYFRAFKESDLVVPVQVTGLAVTTSSPGAYLSWTPNLGLGVTYNIYRGTASGTETLLVSGIQTPWFYEVPGAGTWYYKVSASNYMGEGSLSSEVSITFSTPPALPYLALWTAANGTPLASYTMDNGNGFTALAGTWTIEGNKLSCDAGGAFEMCATETYHSDCTIELDIVYDSSDVSVLWQAIYARATDANNGLICGPRYDNNFHIFKWVGGNGFDLQATPIGTIVAGTTVRVRLTLSGDQISGVYDVLGTPVTIPAVTCDFNQTVTKHGAFCYQGWPGHLFGRFHVDYP